MKMTHIESFDLGAQSVVRLVGACGGVGVVEPERTRDVVLLPQADPPLRLVQLQEPDGGNSDEEEEKHTRTEPVDKVEETTDHQTPLSGFRRCVGEQFSSFNGLQRWLKSYQTTDADRSKWFVSGSRGKQFTETNARVIVHLYAETRCGIDYDETK